MEVKKVPPGPHAREKQSKERLREDTRVKESRHCKALNEDKHYAREQAEITEKERKGIEKPRTILDENEMN